MDDAVVMLLQRIERSAKQTGSYLAANSFRLPESRPRACRRSSQAG